MYHRTDCPECGALLTYTPCRCSDCGWRPWYRNPRTIGVTVLCLGAIALDLRAAFLVAVPPASLPHYFPIHEIPDQDFTPVPTRFHTLPTRIGVGSERFTARPLRFQNAVLRTYPHAVAPVPPSAASQSELSAPLLPDTAFRSASESPLHRPLSEMPEYMSPR